VSASKVDNCNAGVGFSKSSESGVKRVLYLDGVEVKFINWRMTCSGRLRIGRSPEGWEFQRDSGCGKGLELQRDSGFRKRLESQRDSRSRFKRNRAVCRIHCEARPVGKN
jgi:hypothetical protein